MPKRGRPRKCQSLFTVKNFIEYTSDSESDVENVQHNVNYEIQQGSLQSIGRHAELQPQLARKEQQTEPMGREISLEPQQQQEQMGESIISDDDEHMENMDGEIPNGPQGPMQQQQQQDQQIGESIDTDDEEEEISVQNPRIQPQDQQQQQDNRDEYISDEDPADNAIPVDQVLDSEDSEISDDEPQNMPDDPNFDEVLEDLKSKWLFTENKHCVSKTASEAFWRLAAQHFPKLGTARGKKKIPQFRTIRNQMHEDLLPTVDLEIAYRNKTTGEIEIVKDTVTPRKRFSSTNYEKIFEIGTLKVSFIKNDICQITYFLAS